MFYDTATELASNMQKYVTNEMFHTLNIISEKNVQRFSRNHNWRGRLFFGHTLQHSTRVLKFGDQYHTKFDHK